jgi:hypothetical protein
MIRGSPITHIATALIVSFLGEFAGELAAFHLTTALVHRLARFAAGPFLPRARRRRCHYRKNQPSAYYRLLHVIIFFQMSSSVSFCAYLAQRKSRGIVLNRARPDLFGAVSKILSKTHGW